MVLGQLGHTWQCSGFTHSFALRNHSWMEPRLAKCRASALPIVIYFCSPCLKGFLFLIQTLSRAHEFSRMKKKYDKHFNEGKRKTNTQTGEKTFLPFGHLKAKQIFFPEERILSICLPFLAQLDFYKGLIKPIRCWEVKARAFIRLRSAFHQSFTEK